ncbi:MAG: hypothetical protein R2825_14565 [Saprospiraceae bacterium]
MAKRPLQSFYILLYLDAIHFKVGKRQGHHQGNLHGLWGAGRWVEVFYAFMRGRVQRAQRDGGVYWSISKTRVEDVLFFCVDGLGGFKEPFWKSTRNRLSSGASCI